MKTLGSFHYCQYQVKLTCSDDELDYTVSMTWTPLSRIKGVFPVHEETVHNFDNLSKARGIYEQLVEKVISQTSLSDVSLYMQRS